MFNKHSHTMDNVATAHMFMTTTSLCIGLIRLYGGRENNIMQHNQIKKRTASATDDNGSGWTIS